MLNPAIRPRPRERDPEAPRLPASADGPHLLTFPGRRHGGSCLVMGGTTSTVGGRALRTALDVFEQPAFLCSADGEIRYANQAARRRWQRPPPWLAQVGHDGRAGERAGDGREPRRIPLADDLELVVLPAAAGGADRLGALPPSLARVAELVAAGLTDQEIADRMGLTHKTVRTYVSRIYRRLGVSNRVMLTRMLVAR